MARSRAGVMLALAAVTVLGAAVRFWRLDIPPSWLDESVTALIAAGRGPDAMPLGRVVPLQHVADIFDPHAAATAGDVLAVFHDPRVQDLHPPTFHLLANAALRAGFFPDRPLVARVRALAVLFGIASIVATFFAAREAFDDRAALTAAALVAVSPYAVMLSREARNYSAAMLFTACSMWAFLALVRRIDSTGSGDADPATGHGTDPGSDPGSGRGAGAALWMAWAAVCAAGLYVHYFTLFASLAQAGALAFVAWRARSTSAPRWLTVSCLAVTALFLPWVPTLITQQASPEQRWLSFAVAEVNGVDTPYRIASAFQTMLLGKAWDLGEPVYSITRRISLIIFLVTLAALAHVLLRQSPAAGGRRRAMMVFAVVGLTALEYAGATLLLQKAFLSEVRYLYAFYVPFAIGVAWAFSRLPNPATAALIAASLTNTVMVDLDHETWKGTDLPPVVARLTDAPRPTLIVGGSASFNETVVYETILNEFVRQRGVDGRDVAMVQRTPRYASLDIHSNPALFWTAFDKLRPDVLPASVMVHSAGMRPADYQKTLTVTSTAGATATCTGERLDDAAFADDHQMIRPLYRLYRCGARTAAVEP